MSWSAGYVTDVDYTYGYYSELNPYYARFVLQDAGYALPAWHTACELGFGQGMSVNLHAASGSLQWYANDFNPQHAAFAQELAAISGSGAELSDESFAEFCARDDLPQFDFIGLHGIWSWISPDNRALIVDFVRRRLRVGGVCAAAQTVCLPRRAHERAGCRHRSPGQGGTGFQPAARCHRAARPVR